MENKQLLSFIGSGSCFNVVRGNNSAFFKVHNTMILLDCGESVFGRIIELNLLDGIKRVDLFITHTHSDHIGSIPSLVFYCNSKGIHVNINTADENYDRVKSYLTLSGITMRRPNEMCMLEQFRCDEFGSSEGLIIEGEYSISFLKVKHMEGVVSHAIVIDTIGQGMRSPRYLYTGDTSGEFLTDEFIDEECFTEIYCDVSSYEFPNNPHLNITNLINATVSNKDKIFCMHIDSDITVEIAKRHGYNVVENI